MSSESSLRQRRNEREVTDPVTHLPLIVHDHSSGDLEEIPGHLLPSQSSLSSKSSDGLQRGADDSNGDHRTLSRLLREELQSSRWRLPGDTEMESRTKIQTAVVASCVTVVVGPAGLFLLWVWSFVAGRGSVGLIELLIGILGCFMLALVVGGCVLFLPFSKLLGYLQVKLEAPVEEQNINLEAVELNIDQDEASVQNEFPESAAWLNTLFHALWPIVNPAIFTSVSDMLEDSLQATLPKFVHGVRVADIGQGCEPLRILGMRSLEVKHVDRETAGVGADEGEFFNLEVAIAYRAPTTNAGEHSKALKDRARNAHLCMEFLIAGGVLVPVWVELTGLIATARMRIHLSSNPPFFALMTLTLLGQPKITMVCTPLAKNFLNVMDVPGLSGWIQSAIDSAASAYMAPRSLTLDLKTMLMGQEVADTQATGILVVTVKSMSGGDNGSIFNMKDSTGDFYVVAGWSKWGNPLWSSRIIKSGGNPVWEERTALLVGPSEINAHESLRLQLWDSDLLTADTLLGSVELPLKDIMQHSVNQMSARQDRFTKANGTLSHGVLSWEYGFFGKTSVDQRLNNTDRPTNDIQHQNEDEVSLTTTDDKLKYKDDQQEAQAVAANVQIPPPMDWPSGILSITIEQITGLEVEKPRKSGVKEYGEDEEAEDLPSAYCTVIINHQRVYKTRTKMKANNPFFAASTEKFIRDWRSTVVLIAVRDSRIHELHPILGVVILPLRTLLSNGGTSHLYDSFPLVGGIGHGRMRLSLTFRSVQLQLPPRLLGWDVGTLDIASLVTASPDLPPDILTCRLILRTPLGKGKMEAGADGGWSTSQAGRNVRLAVMRRYASCLVVEFQKHIHSVGLSLDRTPAFAVLWLKDLPDGQELEVPLAVHRNEGGALVRAEANCTEDVGERIGEIRIKVRLWPGLSGYHQNAATKDTHLGEVMEALDCAEESGNVEKDSVFDQESVVEQDDAWSVHESSESIDRTPTTVVPLEEPGKKMTEKRRTHKGLMQWKAARNLAWAGHSIEKAVDKAEAKITGAFKHHEREIGIEKEV
ncbi:hypothetical protein H0H92_011741 [Tricholoma furcatifolium]|nr:hypothetical protein H0H92_011741 [Tricholoma furcatifolium]